ncbi:MAG: hypothetical protein VYB61_07255, partial [Verrucomicrobiota bacterium]|nr:hypothetical protein [Verrucomicrobiota bacterium]
RYDVTRSTLNADRHRLDAEHAYNLALLQLEEALGTSLSKVFAGSKEAGQSGPTTTAPAAPAHAATQVKNHSPDAAEENAQEGKEKRTTLRSKVRSALKKIRLLPRKEN